MMRLLLVEDDERLAAWTGKGLREAGFVIDHAATAADADAALAGIQYDAMILDLGLPDQGGLALLGKLRLNGNSTPVLILSARGSVGDRVVGLNDGADDYLAKPFEMGELVARLRALMRRPATTLGRYLETGGLRFDTATREVSYDGRVAALSRRELDLLEHLMRRTGRVVPKDMLEEKLYGFGDEVVSNSLEVVVHRLRRRLSDIGAAVQVHTIRGVGYLIAEPAA